MKRLSAFLLAVIFVAIGAYDVGVYAHSSQLGIGILMIGTGLLIGMVVASMPDKS